MLSKKWAAAGVVGIMALTAPLYAKPLIGAVQPSAVYAASEQQNAHVITVTGAGEMTVAPDVAYVNLGVQTQAETANEAQAANAETFAKLEKLIYDTYKLDKKDVKTSGFSVQPQYTYAPDKEPQIKGYQAMQMLQVTYRDLAKLGTFLDDASKAGANKIDGVQFSTEKSREYELQVIQKAMDNAKEKAQVIARYAGRQLGDIISVTQGGGSGAPVAYASIEKAMARSAASDAATSITPGELKITTNVTVEYSF
jgi:hypothetical protein